MKKIEFIEKPLPPLGFGGGHKALDDSMQFKIYKIVEKLKELSENGDKTWNQIDIEKISFINDCLVNNLNVQCSYKKETLKEKIFKFFKN